MSQRSKRLGLRARIALFFALLALGGAGAMALGLWLGWSRAGGPAAGYVLAGIVGAGGLAALAAWVAVLFDDNVARPIETLASDLSTRAAAPVEAQIDETPARYLGALAPSANAIHAALAAERAAQAKAVARETDRIAREKALLEALLHDLGEGVVVVAPDLRIMLFNRAARELLGTLGLDRPLDGAVRPEPLLQARDRSAARRNRGEAATESFFAATRSDGRLLIGRLSPMIAKDEIVGYVIAFHDATDDLRAHAERDHLFNTLLEQVRRPASAMGALIDVLHATDLEPVERERFDHALKDELDRLYAILGEMEARHGAATTRHWPTSAVAVADIFDALVARARVPLSAEAGAAFVQCDGFAVVELLACALSGLDDGSRSGFAVEALLREGEVWLALEWQGPDVPDGDLQRWLAEPLSEGYGAYSGRDALAGHRTEMWSETAAAGHRLVLPLRAAGAPTRAPAAARPEFYDFDLAARPAPGALAERPLRSLTFTVFDTETTGLSPRSGDEIVQIAALRIVNGRILPGEAFETLVDPGRPVPASATAVHGLGDADLAGAPGIAEAGRAFHAFAEGSVLVAHNAAFDLAFLQMKEAAIGTRFANPALCTVLLSATVFEHTGNHTLDALAERLDVTLPPEVRHTAMGDTQATAEILLRLLSLLEDAGIVTLGDALEASARQSRIRAQQAY